MIVYNTTPTQSHDFLPPARTEFGVTNELTPETGMVMGRFFIEPGMVTRPQYEINADLALFIVEGAGNLSTGPKFSAKVDTFSSKDFIFIEHGEIFSIENTSDQVCSIVFSVVGIDHPDDLKQVLV